LLLRFSLMLRFSLTQWRPLLPDDDELRSELPVTSLSLDDDPRLDEPCHELDEEPLLGLLDEDDPISLDPLLRPEELSRPSSLFILSRLRLSIQPPFRLVGSGFRRATV
jgi:hypothetical protein